MAQPEPIEKQVMRVACNDSCWEMNYSDDGLLTSIYSNTGDERQLLWSYDYHASLEGMPYVYQKSYYPVSFSAYHKARRGTSDSRPRIRRQTRTT